MQSMFDIYFLQMTHPSFTEGSWTAKAVQFFLKFSEND